MSLNIRIKVVDKKGLVFEGFADFCEIPTEAGIEGVLPGHINFISNLIEGKIRYKTGETVNEIDIVGGGFVEISGDCINVMINS
ncbi:MAG TPA: hypothetical protein ENI54_00715 [bacterium]|nr:hypothetical protein [bacterium]